MSITVNDKNLGHATAYAYAKSAGYTGTEAEFAELLGNIADDLSEIENLRATATTLPAGSAATASYADGVLTLGIPKGDKGDKGDTGAQGPKGDTGEVSYAEFNPVVADVTQLRSNLNDVNETIFTCPYVNIYNKALVTSETITADKTVMWNGTLTDNVGKGVTPLLPIEPNKRYIIGIIPAYGSMTVPWYGMSTCGAFYDANGTCVGYWSDTNTFTTPQNATQYRMNLALSFAGLDTINNRCVIAEGSTLPSEYIPYSEARPTKFDDIEDEIAGIEGDITDINEKIEQFGGSVKHHLSGIMNNGYVLIRNGITIYEASNSLHATYNDIAGYVGKTVYVSGKSNNIGDDGKAFVLFGFYDVNGNLLLSHQSAANAAYINVEVTVPENATKLLVNGVSDYPNYIPSVIVTDGANTTNYIAYEKYNDTLYISTKYGTGNIDIEFGKRGPNQLPDFKKITADGRTKYNGSSDMHSPFTIKAVNNADGDDVDNHTYTGGNHNYGDTGTTDYSATARNLSFDMYADGQLLSNGDYGLATELMVKWVNRVQGYNTKKSDGTGREIIEERHTILFDGVNWTSTVELEPLEDVVIENYYGYQCPVSSYPNIHMVGATYKKEFVYTSPHDSGNSTPNVYVACSTDDRLEMEVDRSYDMGKGTYYSGTQGFRTFSGGKGYSFLIANLPASEGDIYGARGWYRFLPQY